MPRSLCAAFSVLLICLVHLSQADARVRVEYDDLATHYAPGTIIISQSARRLFLVEGQGSVRSYRVAVGKVGKAWLGPARISGKHVAPAWSPPASVKRDNPRLPDYIPGGAPQNPMGGQSADARPGGNRNPWHQPLHAGFHRAGSFLWLHSNAE